MAMDMAASYASRLRWRYLSFLHFIFLCTVAGISSFASARDLSNCSQVTEQAEGPYWIEENIETFNLRSNLTFGVPLNLTVRVTDAALSSRFNQCVPVTQARIDIWQCRYDGVYSDEDLDNTQGEKWLRGYQNTNTTGYATFYTIYPGWYAGRTVHIHLRLRIYMENGSTLYDDTTQLYFDDSTSNAIFKDVFPYNDRGGDVRDTYNYGDDLYTSNNQLRLSGSYKSRMGFTSTVELSVPFAQTGRISRGSRRKYSSKSRTAFRSGQGHLDVS